MGEILVEFVDMGVLFRKNGEHLLARVCKYINNYNCVQLEINLG